MGLGKLNYLNRKSEGPKLGAIVAKDLRKRMSTIVKDAKGVSIVPLEICLAGKSLTDDGLLEVVAGLMDVITSTRYFDTSMVLEEINLSGNKLTVKSLKALAPVVELSRPYLKDLDLSTNQICVASEEDADDWEAFLRAFEYCEGMMRLVFSNNDLSNGIIFEIFARVYAEHAIVDEDPSIKDIIAGGPVFEISDRSKAKKSLIRLKTGLINVFPTCVKPRGLCAIPYIILLNVKLNDPGALWLSYILEHHDPPGLLMTSPMKAGPMAIASKDHRQKAKCDGIVYHPNESLSLLGWKILDTAEQARQRRLNKASVSTLDSIDVEELSEMEENGAAIVELAKERPADLESLRRKFQRNAIETRQRTQLWKAALKTVVYSRTLLPSALKQTDGWQRQNTPCLHDRSISEQRQNINTNWNRQSTGQSNFRAVDLANMGFLSILARSHTENIAAFRRRVSLPIEPLPWPKSPKKSLTRLSINQKLPAKILVLIIANAADPLSVLSDEQRKRAQQFGKRGRETLNLEQQKEWKSKGESHQIWHVLEAIGCLEYEMSA